MYPEGSVDNIWVQICDLDLDKVSVIYLTVLMRISLSKWEIRFPLLEKDMLEWSNDNAGE